MGDQTIEDSKNRYKEAKRMLSLEIVLEKNKKWKELIDEVQDNVWGQIYIIPAPELA